MKKPKFSILTLLLVTAIIGLSLALFISIQQRNKIEDQLTRIENATGLINVQHDNLIYWRRLPQPAPSTWAFRYHLPEGKYRLCIGEGVVPPGTDFPPIVRKDETFGPPPETAPLGQSFLSVYVQREHDRWFVGRFDGFRRGRNQVTTSLQWIRDGSYGILSTTGRTERASANQTITLFRMTENDDFPFRTKALKKVDNPRVFQIWIEPVPDGQGSTKK